ncbi:hypothetical protein AB7M18_005141 [Pseudomonas viridiflava]
MIEPMTVRRIRNRTRSVLRGVTTLERRNDRGLKHTDHAHAPRRIRERTRSVLGGVTTLVRGSDHQRLPRH